MKKLLFLLLILPVSLPAIEARKLFNIRDYGAVGDRKTDDAKAIQKAIDECSAAGGGQVLIPAGATYLAGPFKLKSFIDFHVEAGAKVLASADERVYTGSAFRNNKGEGTIWIGGNDLKQVTISGGGIIDGNGISFMGKELEDSYELKPFNIIDPRPHLLTISRGKPGTDCRIVVYLYACSG